MFIRDLEIDTTYVLRVSGDEVDVPAEYPFQVTEWFCDCDGEDEVHRGGDINGDGFIDIDDLIAMLDASVFGKAVSSENILGDIDKNGVIDAEDIVWLLDSENFNQFAPVLE